MKKSSILLIMILLWTFNVKSNVIDVEKEIIFNFIKTEYYKNMEIQLYEFKNKKLIYIPSIYHYKCIDIEDLKLKDKKNKIKMDEKYYKYLFLNKEQLIKYKKQKELKNSKYIINNVSCDVLKNNEKISEHFSYIYLKENFIISNTYHLGFSRIKEIYKIEKNKNKYEFKKIKEIWHFDKDFDKF